MMSAKGDGGRTAPFNVRPLAVTAMLSAVSYILAFLQVQIPLTPPFVKLDLADVPALIAAFAVNPLAGVVVELVKNVLQLTTTITGGVGELANFLIGTAMVLPAGLIYHSAKSKSRALAGCAIGSVAMAVVAAALNYFVLLPLYSTALQFPIEEILKAFSAAMPFLGRDITMLDAVLFNSVPFNLFKGVVVSFVTVLLYKRISPILKKRS